MRHSQDKGKDLHRTLVSIEQAHADQVNALTAELSDARWQIKIRDDMLRIITGGDQEMIEVVRRQAVEADIARNPLVIEEKG